MDRAAVLKRHRWSKKLEPARREYEARMAALKGISQTIGVLGGWA